MLETKALNEAPLWYNVYKKYPPNPEPYSDRPEPPQDPIPEIVYKEDFQRAKKSNLRHYQALEEATEDVVTKRS